MVVVMHLFLFIRKNFRGICDWIGHNAPYNYLFPSNPKRRCKDSDRQMWLAEYPKVLNLSADPVIVPKLFRVLPAVGIVHRLPVLICGEDNEMSGSGKVPESITHGDNRVSNLEIIYDTLFIQRNFRNVKSQGSATFGEEGPVRTVSIRSVAVGGSKFCHPCRSAVGIPSGSR